LVLSKKLSSSTARRHKSTSGASARYYAHRVYWRVCACTGGRTERGLCQGGLGGETAGWGTTAADGPGTPPPPWWGGKEVARRRAFFPFSLPLIGLCYKHRYDVYVYYNIGTTRSTCSAAEPVPLFGRSRARGGGGVTLT